MLTDNAVFLNNAAAPEVPNPCTPDLVFLELLDRAGDGMIIADALGVIGFAGGAVHKIFGYDSRELAGKHISLILPETSPNIYDSSRRRKTFSEIIRALRGDSRVLAARMKDGRRVFVELTIAEALAGGGRKFLAIARDVTMRRTEDRVARAFFRMMQRRIRILERRVAGMRASAPYSAMSAWGRQPATGKELLLRMLWHRLSRKEIIVWRYDLGANTFSLYSRSGIDIADGNIKSLLIDDFMNLVPVEDRAHIREYMASTIRQGVGGSARMLLRHHALGVITANLKWDFKCDRTGRPLAILGSVMDAGGDLEH